MRSIIQFMISFSCRKTRKTNKFFENLCWFNSFDWKLIIFKFEYFFLLLRAVSSWWNTIHYWSTLHNSGSFYSKWKLINQTKIFEHIFSLSAGWLWTIANCFRFETLARYMINDASQKGNLCNMQNYCGCIQRPKLCVAHLCVFIS